MLTIYESALFSKLWPDYWTEDERAEFVSWLAIHPDAGDVIPGSGGVRKIRWSRKGAGKRGGIRVIYFNQFTAGHIWLLTLYSKSAAENIPSHVLKAIKEEIDNAQD
jgi:hypothetical protein